MGQNLILLGAGASHGSDSDSERVPPLGAHLFKALADFDPEGWGQVCWDDAEAFRKDFEVGMASFSSAHQSQVDRLQRAMAAYFFDFRPGSNSLYLKLADRMRQTAWKGALASLNYERLLELSLLKSDVTPRVAGLEDSNGEIDLVLPHGCCHLFINIRMERIQIGSPSIQVESQDPPRAIHDRVKFEHEITTNCLPPVMCYFEAQKKVRSGPSFIEGQRQQFDELVRHASVIGIIGVKVRPHDKHIWDPLGATSARLVYCAGKGAGTQFRNWTKTLARIGDDVLSAYWIGAFDEVCSSVGIAPGA